MNAAQRRSSATRRFSTSSRGPPREEEEAEAARLRQARHQRQLQYPHLVQRRSHSSCRLKRRRHRPPLLPPSRPSHLYRHSVLRPSPPRQQRPPPRPRWHPPLVRRPLLAAHLPPTPLLVALLQSPQLQAVCSTLPPLPPPPRLLPPRPPSRPLRRHLARPGLQARARSLRRPPSLWRPQRHQRHPRPPPPQ